VEISIKQIDTNNFSITCRDNGMGFENSDSVKMFSSSYTTKEHGTGQGLHSIANFINSLNGSLNFVSEGRLQGSSFTATVPLRAEIEPATYQLTTN
jgi:sensor histidine kinase regulating citrate/malate metabolism